MSDNNFMNDREALRWTSERIAWLERENNAQANHIIDQVAQIRTLTARAEAAERENAELKMKITRMTAICAAAVKEGETDLREIRLPQSVERFLLEGERGGGHHRRSHREGG